MEPNQLIVCKRLDDVNDSVLNLVEKTYTDSFPREERRDFSLVRELIHSNPCFKVYILYKNEQYVGFLSAWTLGTFTYAEHFAIESAYRNGGIGAEALRQFLAVANTPVVLEVEMPADEISKRRIGFYQRQGFVLDNHVYFQPPYRPEEESQLEMRLMTYGALNLNTDFATVRDLIHSNVYGVTL